MSRIKDAKLSKEGREELEWARENMPLLAMIGKRFEKQKPFRGITIGVCLHLEKKTGVLLETLKKGGASIAAASCNPLTTDDRVAAALADEEMDVYAWAGEDEKDYYKNINSVLDHKPDLLIDDGCDQIFMVHTKRKELIPSIRGACEETTTGVTRLHAMEREGRLKFPVVAVNDAYSKFLFDNRFGTAQSTIDAIMRATNKLLAGKTIVVIGFGWCGRGISERLRGLGANVIVVEVSGRLGREEGPAGQHKALEALYSGFRVMNLDEAATEGEFFITSTGNINVISRKHFGKMRDGAILANAGHFNNEIDIKGLEQLSSKRERVKENVERFTLRNGKKLYLLSEGRLVNLARPSGQGHPIEIMDGSFAIQALSLEFILKNKLPAKVISVPRSIDDEVAELALEAKGIKLSKPSEEQESYARSWKEGT
ncbi:adenosylhomocysteinase [Candidatus Micrarchaeota archaeon]|nr:adenosylhomocysteinase [Candidatus Micrarchaeota archaeon]